MKRFIYALPAILLFSCQYDTHLTFGETQCANPWESNHNQSIYIQNIKHYLWTQGIETGEVTVEEYTGGGGFCAACECPSGRTIHINIMEEDKAKAMSLGFH